MGLGWGGVKRVPRLLELLQAPGRTLFYTPSDVSSAMVLTARRAALKVIPPKRCFPFVCDLATATDLPRILSNFAALTQHHLSRFTFQASRLFTFFGMIPNFEPQIILPRLE